MVVDRQNGRCAAFPALSVVEDSMPRIAMLTLFCWLTILLKLGSVGGTITVPSPKIQPVYVKLGSKLELICEQSKGYTIQWSKAELVSSDYQPIDSNNNTGVVFLRKNAGKQVLSLMKDNVTQNDEGSYRCTSGRDLPYTVDVFVLQVTEKWGLITNLGNSSLIGCTVSSKEKIGMEMFWSRHDKVLNFEARAKYNRSIVEDENSTALLLAVKNVGESDVGTYQCNIKLKNGNKFIHDVNLYAFSQVKPMGRSKNLVEGRTLELTCKVWGWPLPNVSWSFEGSPLNWSDSRVTIWDTRDSLEGSKNGTLKIEDVTASDRAVYTCAAWNQIGGAIHETRTSILVRVKGKLAMLWPLIGIALEVIILSCIICVYERNRARQRAEQESKEAADHQSNSNAQPRQQGRDNARYRK